MKIRVLMMLCVCSYTSFYGAANDLNAEQLNQKIEQLLGQLYMPARTEKQRRHNDYILAQIQAEVDLMNRELVEIEQALGITRQFSNKR